MLWQLAQRQTAKDSPENARTLQGTSAASQALERGAPHTAQASLPPSLGALARSASA
jgi:hypothetical protein